MLIYAHRAIMRNSSLMRGCTFDSSQLLQLDASWSLMCFVTKQYNLLVAKVQWYFKAGKIITGLVESNRTGFMISVTFKLNARRPRGQLLSECLYQVWDCCRLFGYFTLPSSARICYQWDLQCIFLHYDLCEGRYVFIRVVCCLAVLCKKHSNDFH